MITITLSAYPPTANHLYANGSKGRYKTREYTRWIKEAGQEIMIQRPGSVKGPYSISVSIGKPKDNRRRDLSNTFKALSDLLVRHGVVEDDHLEQCITMQWADIEGCRIEIEAWT